MADKILGKARISLNGKTYDTKKGASLDPGGDIAESHTSSRRVAGYSEKVMPSKLECKIPKIAGVSVSELRGLRNATITFDGDDGKIFTVPAAWTVEPAPKFDDQSGEISLTMEGEPAEEHG